MPAGITLPKCKYDFPIPDVPHGPCDGQHVCDEALRAGPRRHHDAHGASQRGRLPTGRRQRHPWSARLYVASYHLWVLAFCFIYVFQNNNNGIPETSSVDRDRTAGIQFQFYKHHDYNIDTDNEE